MRGKIRGSILILLILLVSLSRPISSKAQGAITLTDEKGEYPLGLYLEILADKKKQWAIEDVTRPEMQALFIPSSVEVPNFGFTDSAYWVRFRVRNETNEKNGWRLEINRSNINHIDLYLPSPERDGFAVKQTGNLLPFASRDVSHHHFIFNLVLPPLTEQIIYLRFESQASLALPLTLWSPAVFEKKIQQDLFALGLLFGILLVMLGYNSFLWFSLQQKSYFYHVLFLLSILFLEATLKGLAKQYVWPNLTWWSMWSLPISGSFVVITMLGFTGAFLNTKIDLPKLHRFIVILQIGLAIQIALIPVVAFDIITPIGFGLYLLCVPIIIGIGFISWRQGYHPALYFLLAWFVFIGAAILLILIYLGVLAINGQIENGLDIGVILFVLLLSLALADRIKATEQEITERKSVERILQKALDHQEQQVNERTAELAQANVNLKAEIADRLRVEEALRESEQKFRSIVEQSQDGIVLTDEQGIIVEWNRGQEQIIGLKRREAIGRPIWDIQIQMSPEKIITQKHFEQLKAVMITCLQTGQSPVLNIPYEINIRRLDGTMRVIQQIAFAIETDNGFRLSSIIRDITKQKEAEVKIQAALQEKEILLREIHHRVKNNIQAIISMFRLQQEEFEDERVAAIFKEGENRIRTMGLVHEMLYQTEDLAKIDFEAYLKKLVNYLLRSYGIYDDRIVPRIQVENVFLKLDTAISCGLLINELVSNSLKYGFPQGRKGEVRLELRPLLKSVATSSKPGLGKPPPTKKQETDFFELIVSDNGVGLPEDLDFENTTTLGLTLVLGWVAQLQGEIKLDRTAGTHFQIRFKN